MPRALACLVLGLVVAASARADGALVARSSLRGSREAGLVFFLAAEGKAGAVAVGAAHSFDRTLLAEVGEVAFLPAEGREALATSRRYYARPGQAFHRPGATPRDDFVVFALDAPPRNLRVLEAAGDLPQPGERVRLVGIRSRPTPGEVALAGTVVESTSSAIEVELDVAADLRGFGGAPILRADGRVIGLLQAARPSGQHTRASAGPIAGVTDAMAEPYEAGLGRLFATLAPEASAANSPVRRRRAATGSPYGDLSPDEVAARLRAALALRRGPPDAGPSETVALAIEVPEPGAIFGESAGAFLAGRALAQRSGSGRFDIFIVIDTSGSTAAPSGVDVDGDGQVGVATADQDPESTDPDDSILAAEIAAAERLIDGLDPKRTRVGIVSFAGDPVVRSLGQWIPPTILVAALTQEPLTSDYRRVRHSLAEIARDGAHGGTHMAAGIDLATLELLGLAGSVGSADPDSTKMILFFTDGQPTLPHDSEVGNVGAVLGAAQRARQAGVRIHSFAIGPEALEGPIATVEMAAITGGSFTPVRDPGRLVESVDEVRFVHVEALEVRNSTSGAGAHDVRLHADGSWEALVPLAVGKNRLEVVARGSQGAEARASILVHHAPGAASPFIPAELVTKRNRLLQRRLVTLEADRLEALRRELVVELERERAGALERAARQRKELELEVFSAPSGAGRVDR